MLQENPEGAMEQFEIFARENPDDPADMNDVAYCHS